MKFAYLFGYKCKTCGKRFKLRKENKYLVQAEQGPFGKLAGPAAVYDAYDCPVCGSQNRANVRYPYYVPDVYVLDDEDEEQEGEPEGWSVEVIPDAGKSENYFHLHLDPESNDVPCNPESEGGD